MTDAPKERNFRKLRRKKVLKAFAQMPPGYISKMKTLENKNTEDVVWKTLC